VFFCNLGDSYNGSGGAGGDYGPGGLKEGQPKYSGRNVSTLKPKDLAGVPWRVALALQADGWYLRRDVIWHKRNPMPESAGDRPTTAHEYVFLFSKSPRYYWDKEAVKEPAAYPNDDRGARTDSRRLVPGANSMNGKTGEYRNIRSVWTLSSSPYRGCHYATFPPKLIEPMIKAGSSEKGCCPVCGKAWVRVVEKGYRAPAQEDVIAEMVAKGVPRQKANLYGNPTRDPKLYAENPDKTLGWRPDCACYGVEIIGAQPTLPAKKEKETQAEYERRLEEYERARAAWLARWTELSAIYDTLDVIPCTILDPFIGSGTTALVARQLGRSAIGLDLSYTYLKENATKRLEMDKLKKWSGK
jgi:hypothetical protein